MELYGQKREWATFVEHCQTCVPCYGRGLSLEYKQMLWRWCHSCLHLHWWNETHYGGEGVTFCDTCVRDRIPFEQDVGTTD
jgi:hypothetical protein